MKKWLVFFYLFICFLIISSVILFCINIFKEQSAKEQEKKEEKKIEEDKNIIDYKANQTIRVKLCKTGEVVAMDINDYLRGVVPAEMPPYYSLEAIKAQAVVARTFTYKRIDAHAEGEGIDICDNYAHCQAFYNKEQIIAIWKRKGYDDETIKKYWSNVNEAVVSTQDEVITYNGQLIKAFFHASSPERTESVDQIWGGEKLPYLVSVENEESLDYDNRTSKVEVKFDDFVKKLKEDNNSRSSITAKDCTGVKICDYTTSGRVKNIQIANFKISAEKLRTLFGLRSTNFTIEIKDSSIVFNVIGNGHGVGLSQVGADTYAKKGYSYKDIINHYYTNVNIVNLNK